MRGQGMIPKRIPIEQPIVKAYAWGEHAMSELDQALRDLVIGNRILAHQNVVDAYGHISIRHPSNPEHFLLSRSRSPELVVEADIMEFTLDGKVVGDDRRPPYLDASSMAASTKRGPTSGRWCTATPRRRWHSASPTCR